MKKKELLKMPTLSATRTMIKSASKDELVTEKRDKHYSIDKYSIGLYLRCCLQNEILKIAFFFTSDLKQGTHGPQFELYIDRTAEKYLTYSPKGSSWRTACLGNMVLPQYMYYSGEWISAKDRRIISEYLGVEYSGYSCIRQYQYKLLEKALKRRHKKITDPWDKDQEQIQELPSDWLRWVSKVGIPENYLFYQFTKKGVKEGYCTHCEEMVQVNEPRYNAEKVCPNCGVNFTCKSVGKAGTVLTKQYYMFLIQGCRDGFTIRFFEGYRKYPNNQYQDPEVYAFEIRRIICSDDKARAYYWGLFCQIETRWIKTGIITDYLDDFRFEIYIEKNAIPRLAYTGMLEYSRKYGTVNPEKYIGVYDKVPQLEKFVKANLDGLAKDCYKGYWSFIDLLDPAQSKLKKILCLDSPHLKRLHNCNVGNSLQWLQWLQYDKAHDAHMSDEDILWYIDNHIEIRGIKFILDRMNVIQVKNYIQRQMDANNENCQSILNTWKDYLSMAKRLGIDTSDAIVYRVNKLYERHQALVRRINEKPLKELSIELQKKYPLVEGILQSVKEKFEYVGNDYSVVAPTSILDVLQEGRCLEHCVANSERYWERIDRRETHVLFFRRSASPDTSYYTLEVEPNGTVRQTRTKFDRQGEDIDDVRRFLSKWQKIIAKRLTPDDLKLGDKSRKIRIREYAQLQEDQVKINTGDLAGELLVDVLLGDLIETAA